jgi:hypothetical protein
MPDAAPVMPDAHRWLTTLYAHVDPGEWLTLFANDHNGANHTRWAPAGDLDALLAQAEQLAPTCDVWYGVATRRQRLDRGRRGGAADCVSVPALWVDIDIAGPGHKTTRTLPATLDDAHRLLAKLPLAPSCIIHTGGGLHAYWLLDEPRPVADIGALLDAWGYSWASWAAELGWHIDSTWNVDRVLRLPDTHNRKTDRAVAVEILHLDDVRYGLDDLDQWLEERPPPAKTRSTASTPYIGPPRPGDAFNAAVDSTDLLTRAGWQHARTDGTTGDQHWTRPGKDKREGTSGTLYAADGHFTCWSDSVPELEVRRPYDPFGLFTNLMHGGDFRAATKAALDLGYGTRHVTRAELDAWITEAVGTGNADQPPPDPVEGDANPVAPFLVNYGELWAKEAHAEDWLCEPLFARGRGHAMYAGAKTGKSLLTLYVGACLATGRACLHRPAGDPVRILYLDYEMTEDDLRERLETFGFGPDDTPLLQANLHYALLPSLPPLDTAEGGRAIVQAAKMLDVELVIIDTTARAVGGDENDADTYRSLYRHTGLWLKQAGIAYARLDHAGKDVEKGQRGSSAKNDDVDVVWRMIRRDDQALRLTATHRRMSWVPQEVDVAVHEDDDSTRFSTGTGSWPEGTKAVADALDAVGAPLDIGSRDAARIVRDAGLKARNAVIRAAVKHRRQAAGNVAEPVDNLGTKRAPMAGRGAGRAARPESGARWGAEDEMPSQGPGAMRGAVGRAGDDHRAPFAPHVVGRNGGGAPGTTPEDEPEHVRNSWLIGAIE